MTGPLLKTIPWVNCGDACGLKRAGVAGSHSEAVGKCDGRNKGVGRFDRQASSTGLGQQLGVGRRTSHIERQHPIRKHRQQALFQALIEGSSQKTEYKAR